MGNPEITCAEGSLNKGEGKLYGSYVLLSLTRL